MGNISDRIWNTIRDIEATIEGLSASIDNLENIRVDLQENIIAQFENTHNIHVDDMVAVHNEDLATRLSSGWTDVEVGDIYKIYRFYVHSSRHEIQCTINRQDKIESANVQVSTLLAMRAYYQTMSQKDTQP
jgi:hypothetical protein